MLSTCTTTNSNIVEEPPPAVLQVTEDTAGSYSTEEEAYDVGAVAQGAVAVADVDDYSDGVTDGDSSTAAMSWTEYVVAYKRLSESEINSILSRQWKPFESTDLYKDMIDDSSTTKEDLEREAADHEYHEDRLSVWRDRVRKEFADKGFFPVDDDYIAERLELEEFYNQSLREMLSELNLDESIFGDE